MEKITITQPFDRYVEPKHEFSFDRVEPISKHSQQVAQAVEAGAEEIVFEQVSDYISGSWTAGKHIPYSALNIPACTGKKVIINFLNEGQLNFSSPSFSWYETLICPGKDITISVKNNKQEKTYLNLSPAPTFPDAEILTLDANQFALEGPNAPKLETVIFKDSNNVKIDWPICSIEFDMKQSPNLKRIEMSQGIYHFSLSENSANHIQIANATNDVEIELNPNTTFFIDPTEVKSDILDKYRKSVGDEYFSFKAWLHDTHPSVSVAQLFEKPTHTKPISFNYSQLTPAMNKYFEKNIESWLVEYKIYKEAEFIKKTLNDEKEMKELKSQITDFNPVQQAFLIATKKLCQSQKAHKATISIYEIVSGKIPEEFKKLKTIDDAKKYILDYFEGLNQRTRESYAGSHSEGGNIGAAESFNAYYAQCNLDCLNEVWNEMQQIKKGK